MTVSQSNGGVVLKDEQAASTVLYKVLADAIDRYPQALGSVDFPVDVASFRKTYPRILPDFEAARIAHSDSLSIAQYLLQALSQYIVWRDDTHEVPLHEVLAASGSTQALDLHVRDFRGEPGWRPSAVYRGERWAEQHLSDLADELLKRGVISSQAGHALARIADDYLTEGRLVLTGRKVAMMGAGAEMAPTRSLLRAGAEVLWLDTAPPPAEWLSSAELAGRLVWPANNCDLLKQPQAVLTTLIEFADRQPLDLGLYAYAPGRARELRLTAVMNALVNALPQALIRSVTMLVSPTTPTALSAQEMLAMDDRLKARPWWETVLSAMGLLGHKADAVARLTSEARGAIGVRRCLVGIQGASYQAAQYLGKVIAAQHWAERGPWSGGEPLAGVAPLRVSANTAAITRTRSLAHPVFTAAFGGADAFGVETLTPRQSRCLNGLLTVGDWLQPEPPVPGSVRIHGGIHTLPYPLEPALRIAAAIGFVRSPRLIRGLLRGQ